MLARATKFYVSLGLREKAYAACEKRIDVESERGKFYAINAAVSLAVKYKDWGKAIAFKEKILELPEKGNSHEDAIKAIQDYAKKLKEADLPK